MTAYQLFLALAAFFLVCTTTPQPDPANDIFILAGQSNMVGNGGVFHGENNQPFWDGFVPVPDNIPDPAKVFRFTANLTWEVARDPLHIDIDVAPGKTAGVGSGMTFANAIKGTLALPVGLVPCAIGGSEIKEWARGKPNYENMIKRAKVASLWGNIKAILWYQGESDTDTDEKVNAFHDNLVNFILNVRADLDLPHLPIIHVAIATGSNLGLMKIRDIQKGIQLPNLVCVDALGLEIGGDHVHLTTAAQVRLGHMLAEAYGKLAKTSSSPPVSF